MSEPTKFKILGLWFTNNLSDGSILLPPRPALPEACCPLGPRHAVPQAHCTSVPPPSLSLSREAENHTKQKQKIMLIIHLGQKNGNMFTFLLNEEQHKIIQKENSLLIFVNILIFTVLIQSISETQYVLYRAFFAVNYNSLLSPTML